MLSLYGSSGKDRTAERQRRADKMRKLGVIEGSNKWYTLMYRNKF